MQFKFVIYILLLSIVIGIPTPGNAQMFEVKEDRFDAGKNKVRGFSVILEGTEKEVDNMLYRELKTLGKVKSARAFYSVDEPRDYNNHLYARIYRETEASSKVLIGLENPQAEELDRLRQHLQRISAVYYRDMINDMVETAEKELTKSSRVHQRLIKEEMDLKNELIKNKDERAELELKLEQNKKDSVRLENELEKKMIGVEAAYEDLSQKKQKVDLERAKLRDIE
ncbi:MAG: hypothetical protein LAT68_10800 [Cyclobacteriaceae bacterium]|nr:hypothetical protein [Cyclobacteriaceae bacterium]MCH8516804.1 hypothetical protein [Cyclobacteriaceae bacterium]